jgi:hypothetical protein
MTTSSGGPKDGLGRSNLSVNSLTADSTSAGAGEIGNSELAADAVTRAKIDDEALPAGHFTLGTDGAETFVAFSGGGVGMTTVGSALAIMVTPLAATTEPVHVTSYAGSGFMASGAAAIDCMYMAVEEP